MVKEDLKAQLRTKRKQAKKQIQQQPKKPSKPKADDGPSLLTLIYTRKWDQCVQVATTYPKQTERPDRMGDLPLHEACNSGAPFQLIQAIHRSYPPAISHRGFCGRLPLHYASYNKPSLHVIKYLLRLHPDGATQFDDDGRLPLHLAVVRNAPKQAIQALIAAYPKSLSIPNQFGNTPEMLARNDHVYDLLVAEKDKPRGIDQKLDIEKKLMRDWNIHSSPSAGSAGSSGKSPVAVSQQLGNKPTDSMETSVTPKRGSLSIKKQPLSSSNNEKVPKRTQGPSATGTSATTTTTTTKKKGVQIKSWTTNSTQAASTRKSVGTTTRRSSIMDSSSFKKKNSRTQSRSLSSGRSRKTIEATHDDLIFLEDTMMNPKYVASSRLESPKSPLDYNEIIQTRRSKKREIMSTTNRRKVLPSPTREWQYPRSEKDASQQVEWRRRQFSRTVV